MTEHDDDEFADLIEKQGRRVDYSLSFRRSDGSRLFHAEGLDGEDIDDAEQVGQTSMGTWGHVFDPPPADNPDDLFRQFFIAAVTEATHEVCEWFKVDGVTRIDPHHPDYQVEIQDIAEDAGDRIWKLTDQADGVTEQRIGSIEGPKGAPLCDASFIYCGLVPGHRVTCPDCLKEVKVVKGGYTAAHRAWPRTGE